MEHSSRTPGQRKSSLVKGQVVPPRLVELEAIVGAGLRTFIEVGNALVEIRDQRLYKATHATWEAYCRDRWGLSKVHANRQIAAARTAQELEKVGVRVPNERVARAARRHLGMIKLQVKSNQQRPQDALQAVLRREARPQQGRRPLEHPSRNGTQWVPNQPVKREPMALDHWQEQLDQLASSFLDRVLRLAKELAKGDQPKATELLAQKLAELREEVAALD